MRIRINEYYESDHFRSLNEDNFNVSRTCDFEKKDMHHIHNSCEILFIEEGVACYYVSGKKYQVKKNDILVIGFREHHQRRIEQLPFLRCGLTLNPSFCRSLMLGDNLSRVFNTPEVEKYHQNYTGLAQDEFNQLISLLSDLKSEERIKKPFRSQLQRAIITQIAILLFRLFELERSSRPDPNVKDRMIEIKDYIDTHFQERIDLKMLSEKFYLHPATISKDFNRCCGQSLNKYINTVRICEAANLLENSNASISMIAAECGYNSQNTFIRQFKNIMEISPLQYRKSIQGWIQYKGKADYS